MKELTALILFIGGIVCLFFGGWFTAGGLVLIVASQMLGSGE